MRILSLSWCPCSLSSLSNNCFITKQKSSFGILILIRSLHFFSQMLMLRTSCLIGLGGLDFSYILTYAAFVLITQMSYAWS